MINLPVVDRIGDVSGKNVFVRGDIDVPLSQEKITDDTRLREIWPTIEFLLQQGARVILAGHLGRPEGKVEPGLSSRVVAQYFGKLVNSGEFEEVHFGIVNGYKINDQLTLLENLRFFAGEEENNEEFSRSLSKLASFYVNEAFAASEREHASIVGVPKLLPRFAGFRLAKEVEVLANVLESPKRPLTVIIGGAKLETKIPLISKMAEIADTVIVGGKLVAEITVGSFIMTLPNVKLLRLTETTKDTTLESIDRVIGESLATDDLGTIVWNGPVGKVEDYTYQVGTRRIAEMLANSPAKRIVGGGDTIAVLNKLGLTDKFDWVCSGGGSMLKFLAGEKLPGVEALIN